MSDGNDGSGGGGGVRDGGDARDAGPQEPQTPGSRARQTPAPSPGLAVRRARGAAAGGGTEETAGFWKGTWPHGLSPSAVCCGCIAGGAGGGRRAGLGVVSGRHPDPRVLPRRRCAARFAEAGGSRGI